MRCFVFERRATERVHATRLSLFTWLPLPSETRLSISTWLLAFKAPVPSVFKDEHVASTKVVCCGAGTLHFTLHSQSMTEEEAASVRFMSPPPLPLRLTMSGYIYMHMLKLIQVQQDILASAELVHVSNFGLSVVLLDPMLLHPSPGAVS